MQRVTWPMSTASQMCKGTSVLVSRITKQMLKGTITCEMIEI